MELERRLVAREPPPPALPRELPARHTPKKMWAVRCDHLADFILLRQIVNAGQKV